MKNKLLLIFFILVTATSAKADTKSMRYELDEKGVTGEMVISRISGCDVEDHLGCSTIEVYKVEINSVHINSFNTCEVTAIENSSARITDSLTIEASFNAETNKSKKPLLFTVKFTPTHAIVDGDSEVQTNFCGIQGFFFGKYKKK